MRDDRSIVLTTEPEVERLLTEYSGEDLFGDAPAGLVGRALSSVVQPCRQTEAKPDVTAARTALIVISIAAAAICIVDVKLPATIQLPTLTKSASSTAEPQVAVSNEQRAASNTQRALALIEPIRHMRIRRHAILARPRPSPAAPQSVWTDTVVSADEQGVIVPVVMAEDEAGQPVKTGLTVVPIQAAVTYAEYAVERD